MSEGRKGQALHLLHRKSIAMGMKHMYRVYRLKKWVQVQQMVKDILCSLQNGPVSSVPIIVPEDIQGTEADQVLVYANTVSAVYSLRTRMD